MYLNLIFIFLPGHLQFFLHFFFTFMEKHFKKHPTHNLSFPFPSRSSGLDFIIPRRASLLNECFPCGAQKRSREKKREREEKRQKKLEIKESLGASSHLINDQFPIEFFTEGIFFRGEIMSFYAGNGLTDADKRTFV